jgi:hypothetical protein
MTGLVAALLVTVPALPLTCDQPVRAVSTPLQLKVELRNEGAAQVSIPGAGRCDPAFS